MSVRSPYSRAAITLHWLIALLIMANLAGGFWMGGALTSPEPETRQLAFQVVQWHKSIGLTVLVLSLVRLVMRMAAGFPAMPEHMTALERLLARLTHWGFYALMLLLPLTGWLMVSTSPFNLPTIYFGLFEWPHLPVTATPFITEGSSTAHMVLAWSQLVLLVLHVAAALKHHIFDRDDVLSRMLPFLRR